MRIAYNIFMVINLLSANPIKWSNILKTISRLLSTNCLSVFDHFVGLTLKELISYLVKAPWLHYFIKKQFCEKYWWQYYTKGSSLDFPSNQSRTKRKKLS